MSNTLPFLVDLLTNYGVFLIIALGAYVTLSAGQLSLGHGMLASCGGYASGILTVHFGFSPLVSIPIAAIAGTVLGALLCGLVGWRLKGMYLAIATLALCQALVTLLIGLPSIGGPLGLLEIPPVTDLPLTAIVLAGILAILWRLENSHVGREFRAVADDAATAAAIGIDVRRVTLTAWTLGGAISAVGGALYAHQLGSVRPTDFGVVFSLTILLAPALGGYRHFRGTCVGAAIVIFAPQVFSVGNPLDQKLFYAVLLIALMLWRPDGLLSARPARSTAS